MSHAQTYTHKALYFARYSTARVRTVDTSNKRHTEMIDKPQEKQFK